MPPYEVFSIYLLPVVTIPLIKFFLVLSPIFLKCSLFSRHVLFALFTFNWLRFYTHLNLFSLL
jgi:hypothetical protein